MKILKNVVTSAAECVIATAFESVQDATVMCTTLIEMDHKQPPTSIQIDNTAENSFIKGTLKQERTKITDMKCYWLKDRKQQDHFRFFWKPGKQKLA